MKLSFLILAVGLALATVSVVSAVPANTFCGQAQCGCQHNTGVIGDKDTDCDGLCDSEDPFLCLTNKPLTDTNPKNNICDACETTTCTPDTDASLCDQLDKTCGTLTVIDNCGTTRSITCGTCPSGQSCSSQNTCVGTCTPSTEVCDNKDNDCDGQIDEGGVCGSFCGQTSCSCQHNTGVIGDKDTDCDGLCDSEDPFLCLTNKPLTDTNPKNNICDACETTTCTPQCTNKCGGPNGCGGTCASTCPTGQTCQSPLYTTCTGTCIPSTEICNGKDDNCNGQIDEGGVCNTGAGQYTIDKSVASRGPYTDGQLITYRIALSNQNDNDGAFTVLDSISGGSLYSGGVTIEFDPASQVVSGRASSTTVSGTIDNANGVRVTNLHHRDGQLLITYRGRVRAPSLFTSTATVANTAQILGGAQDSDSVTVVGSTPGQPLTISKTVSNAVPADNEVITYTITVRNPNSVSAPSATIYDSIGDNLGVLSGNRGGTLTFLGTETVTGSVNNALYQQPYTGSIASLSGLTLTSIPGNAVVTIRYQTRASTQGIGSRVTSTFFNTASLAGGSSASTKVTLTGAAVIPDTPNVNDPPFILPIPNQPQVCGAGFASLDLDDFIGDPETPNDQLLVSVDGNRIFQARVDPTTHILTVTDPTGTQNNVQDNIRITVRDPQGRTATRTIVYSVLRNPFGTPVVSGIPDQIIKLGKNFDEFDLDDYTKIGGQSVSPDSFDYYVTGSSLFDVTIDENNKVNIDYDEDLFKLTDADQLSESLTFTVRGCSEAKDTAVFSVVRNYPQDPYYSEYESTGTRTRVCTIVPEPGVRLPDKDCDGVPDGADNCLDVANPDQTDKNRNGVGDVCDIIASCTPLVSTDLAGGKTLSVNIEAQNNAGVTTTTTKFAASIDKLGVRDSRTMGGIQPGEFGEATLKLRIPECATSGAYVLTCSVQAAGHTAETRVPLDIKAGSCHAADGGDSSATIFSTQDVIAGSEYGASFPIIIRNDDSVQRSYVMSVDGVLPWGDYVFESGGVVVVPSGSSTTTNLRVYAYDQTIPGDYPFKVVVKSGDEQQETYLKASVQASDVFPAERNGVRLSDLVWLGLLVVVLGLILWGAYAAGKAKRR